MSDNIPRVGTWAKQVPPDGVELADLEAHLFKNHPQILAALGRRKRDKPGSAGSKSAPKDPLQIVKVILGWIVFGAPVIALIGVLPNDGGWDMDTGVAIAQVCFCLAIPGPLYFAANWWRRGRRMHAPDLWGVALIAMSGLFTVGIMTSWMGVVDSMFESPTWPMWIVVGVATLIVLLELILSTGTYDIQSENFPKIGPPDPTRIDELVEALDPNQRRSLRGTRTRALKTLLERGIIDEARKSEAQECGLGKLYTLDASS